MVCVNHLLAFGRSKGVVYKSELGVEGSSSEAGRTGPV